MSFVCEQLSQPAADGLQQCLVWTVQKVSVLDELNALTTDQVHDIFLKTIAFWLVCWGWSKLVDFIGSNSF